MPNTAYPNGQTLTSTALTPQQMNVIFQPLTCAAIGINPPDYSQVRIDWQTQGQPFTPLPGQDVCFLACTPIDGDYGKIRDRTVSGTGPVTETWIYTRHWRIAWILYGPNGNDRARALYSAVVFMDYFSDQLSLVNLYPLPDPTAPTRTPEEINAEWWERADFAITLYEQVTETIQYGAVLSIETKVYDAAGLVADTTVS